MCVGVGGGKARDEGFRLYKKGGVQKKGNKREGIGIKLIGKDLLKKENTEKVTGKN